MITMSKSEISNYLCYYAYLHELFVKRRKMSLLDSFKWFTYANNIEELYNCDFINEMLRTYNFYVNFRMYSIEEDFFLNRDNNINNEDLDTFVHNCKFYEKSPNITNKRLLEVVRNAFNHSLGNDLIVSKNARNFELNIEDTRYPRQIAKGGNPEKLHMRFNIKYIQELNNLITDKGRNILYTGFDVPKDFNFYSKHLYTELDKIKFSHYYFDKKIDPEIMKNFKDLNKKVLKIEGNQENVMNQIQTIADSINLPKTFDLTHDQKISLIKLIEKYRKKYKDWNRNVIDHFMHNILSYLTPVPGLKLPLLNNELWYISLITGNDDLSFNAANRRVLDSINKVDDEKLKDLELKDKLDLCNYLLIDEFVISIPYMIYIDSVITNLCDEEYIEIDGKKYETRRLRNSLVHARWYIGNNKVYLFDGLPENKNDYDLELVACIDLDTLIKWTDNYLAQKNNEQGNAYTLRR